MSSNSFMDIILDDMEHIIHNSPFCNGYGEGYNSDPKRNSTVYPDIRDLMKHNFTKKYILIYSNDSFTHGCDSKVPDKREKTRVIEKILHSNKDKFFMIIDQYAFNHFTLRQHTNCQIWPRKYFSNFLGLCLTDQTSSSHIQNQRKHLFCSILGRCNPFRTEIFNYFLDNRMEQDNKISYMCYSSYQDKESNDDVRKNFVGSGGEERWRPQIPFNNFENVSAENVLHVDLAHQSGRKMMPLYDCLFNVIVESFPDTGTAFYTEKSMNAILYGHIPVVSGGPGIMKGLQDMGIIIPDYIEWPIWDDLELAQLNIDKTKILKRQLKDLTTRYKLEEISEDWYPYALRNYNKLINLENESLEEEKEICRWVLTSTHNLSNPKYQSFYQ